MNVQRSVRKSLIHLMRLAPTDLRQYLYRQMLQIPAHPPANLIVKFAETPSEFDQAFELIQETYADLGYCDRGSPPRRATKYHALPAAKVAIALINGKVVATVTHILDNPMGLPIDNHWNIQNLRDGGLLLAEISSLAVHQRWRHHYGFFLYLTRFLLDYAIHHLGVDAWTIVTHPKTKDFYEGVLCFRPLSNEIKTCGHVNNALGIAQVLDLTSLKDNFFQIYHDNPQHRNIHDFYFVRDFSNFFFLPKFSSILTSSMPDSYFRALFSKSASTIKELSNRDNIILSGLYGDFVAQLGLLHIQNLRMRTLTSISGTLCAGNNLLPVRVLDVSSGGAKIISKHPLPTDLSPLVLAISRPQHPPLQIPIRVVWSKNQRVAGVQIKNPLAGEWLQWTEGLRRQFQRSMLSRVA